MNQVQVVSPDFVYQVWDRVEPYLSASLDSSTGDCTIDQLKYALIRGLQTLFVAVNESDITGAMVVELVNYPNTRVMFINALGGKGVVNQETFAQVEDWARQQGASKVKAVVHDAQARLYKQKSGFTTVRQVVEKKL